MSEVTQEREKSVVAEATADDTAEAETAIAPTPEGVIEGPEVSETEEPATDVEEVELEVEAVSEPEEAPQEPQEVTAEAGEPAEEATEAEEAQAEVVATEAEPAEAQAEVVATEAEPAEAEVKVVELALEEEPTEAEAEEEEEAPAAETKPEEEAPAEEEKPEEKPEPKRKPKRKKTPLQELEAGMETSGRVVGIADFGAFVNIGAETDGLVHISELSDDRVKKVSDVVSVGQQIDVWIKDVDVNKERISLSMRPKPKYRLRDLKPGMVVEGQVTGIRDYGVFVDIGSETEGLVHVSEMAEGYVNKPSELVSVGDDIEVRIKKVDRRRRRISLSMTGMDESTAPPPPEEQESMPTAMEVAMRRALEEGIEETTDAEMDVEDASRDELGDVFNRMLREYREDQEEA